MSLSIQLLVINFCMYPSSIKLIHPCTNISSSYSLLNKRGKDKELLN